MKMTRLQSLFGKKKNNILSVYLTAGYPYLDSTVPVIMALEKGGVGMIELGLPFSDPMADGKTIQDSSTKALRNGMTPKLLLDQAAEARKAGVTVPMILMSYLNPLMQYGAEQLCEDCIKAGIDGMIVPDLPYASDGARDNNLIESARKAGIAVINMITPETSEKRLHLIDEASQTGVPGSFIYMVSDAATTGTRESGFGEKQLDYFRRIAGLNLLSPRLIGFGISDPETLEQAMSYSNGAIIGSLFIKMLTRYPDNPEEAVAKLLNQLGLELR